MSAIEPTRAQVVALRLVEATAEITTRFIEIGQLLNEVSSGGLFGELGYATFEEFLSGHLNIRYRSARYMMRCVDLFVSQLHIPQNELADLGWTRLKELVPVVEGNVLPRDAQHPATPAETPPTKLETAHVWLDRAQGMTTSEINLEVRKAQAPPGAPIPNEAYTTMGIGLWQAERDVVEEALEFAKREAGSERTGTALLHICQDYIQEARARHEHAIAQAGGDSGDV